MVWMAFHFREACANWLTNPAFDPVSQTAEYKACAVRIEKHNPADHRGGKTMTAKCHCATQTVAEISPDTWNRVDAVIARYQGYSRRPDAGLAGSPGDRGDAVPSGAGAHRRGAENPGQRSLWVMSFYSMYTWKPKGKYVIRVCESPRCHVSGAENMLEALKQELGLAVGATTADGLFTLEKSACLGVL